MPSLVCSHEQLTTALYQYSGRGTAQRVCGFFDSFQTWFPNPPSGLSATFPPGR